MLFAHDLPFWVGALGLAAIFSAEISAADALLFMLATSFSQDLYKRFVNPAADDRQVLRCARAAAVAGGVLGFAIAVSVAKTVLDSLAIFYTLLGVSLFVPVVAGLFTRRGGATAALCAIVTGVTVAAGLQWSGGPGFVYGLTPPMWGIALAAMAYVAATLLTSERSRR
jgi:SSS family solute:Na+ symporter